MTYEEAMAECLRHAEALRDALHVAHVRALEVEWGIEARIERQAMLVGVVEAELLEISRG